MRWNCREAEYQEKTQGKGGNLLLPKNWEWWYLPSSPRWRSPSAGHSLIIPNPESRKEACPRSSFSCCVSYVKPALFLIKGRGPRWVAGFALPEHTWSYSSLEVCTVHAVWEDRHTLTWVFTFELHQDKHLHKWKVRRKCCKALPAWEERTVLHRCKAEWLVELCSLGFKVQVFKKTQKCISMHKAWMCRLTNK